MDESPSTVAEAVNVLVAEGYVASFAIADGGDVVCRTCNHRTPAADAAVEVIHRFEGDSDPADEAIVAGVRCLKCGHRGVIVSGYGPSADAPEAAFFVAVTDRRR